MKRKSMNKKIIMVCMAALVFFSMHTLADAKEARAACVSEGDAGASFETQDSLPWDASADKVASDKITSESTSSNQIRLDQINSGEIFLEQTGLDPTGSSLTDSEQISKQQEYTIYQNQLNAQLCNVQLEYLAALEAQREEQWNIEEEKLKLGYAIPIEAEEAESKYRTVQLQIETVRAQQQFYKEVIQLYGREYQEIQVPDTLEELQGDYLDGFSGINLKIYAKELMLQYENTRRKVMETDIQISVLEGKISNTGQLQEAGRATKVQLMELETELKGLEYERMSLIYDAQSVLYILNRKIEDSSLTSAAVLER